FRRHVIAQGVLRLPRHLTIGAGVFTSQGDHKQMEPRELGQSVIACAQFETEQCRPDRGTRIHEEMACAQVTVRGISTA
ncbi:MAG: hypothetical protein QXI19_05910, partial [Candidatus Caldarchaeum sp.]